MKRISISVLVAILFFSGLHAQRRNGILGQQRIVTDGAIVFSVGPAFCSGDVQGPVLNDWFNKTFAGEVNNFNVSLGFRQDFPEMLGFRSPYVFGYKALISYSDFAGSEIGYYHREFTYRSNVMELSFQGQYTMTLGQRYRRHKPHLLYAGIGLGIMGVTSDPGTIIKNGSYVFIPNPGFTIAPVIPMTIGYRYKINNILDIGTEFNWKYAISDLIDGFHPSDGSKNNDFMGGFLIVAGYKILTEE